MAGMRGALCPGMRRLILTAVALTLFGGVASADHWRGRDRDRDNRRERVVVRDHRWNERDHWNDRRFEPRRQVVQRRPVYINRDRFVFDNGRYFTYRRPVIRQRYYDYRYRPQIIVENYDPVPGYIWIQGNWQWNGYEWIWVAGHYDNDPSYGYNDGYNNGYYSPSSYQPCD